MNNFNDPTQTDPSNQPKPFAFCQNCGKPLTHETIRAVGPAVYCEPCLEARLAGATPGPIPTPASGIPGASAGYTSVNAGPPTWGATQAAPTGAPNPGFAVFLGLIPGVGAMYNEQYAKGLVHLIVFAVLVMFANINGIFGLFIMGWEFYMAIEAHHTAKARRDGMPLPNPFGLNDIGDRMGFGKSWTSPSDVASAARDAAQAAGFRATTSPYAAPYVPPVPDPAATPPPAWGAPADAYAHTAVPPAQPYANVYSTPNYGAPGYAAPFIPPVPPIPPVPSRFPVGAIWLIGLGVLFLLGTTELFHNFRGDITGAFVLLGLGVTIFVRSMTCTGASLAPDGTAAYQLRLLRALRCSAFLMLLGILALLNNFHIIRWHYSWPWLIILAGVLALLNRVVSNSVAYGAYTQPPVPPTPPAASVAPNGGDWHPSAQYPTDPYATAPTPPTREGGI